MSGGGRGHTIGDVMKDGITKVEEEKSTLREEDAISAIKWGSGLFFDTETSLAKIEKGIWLNTS